MSSINLTPHASQAPAATTHETLKNTPYQIKTVTTEHGVLARAASAAGTVISGALTVAAAPVDVLTGGHFSLTKKAINATKELASVTYNGKTEDARHVEQALSEADQDEIDTQTRFTEALIKQDITNDRYKKSENGPYAYKTDIKTVELSDGRKINLSYFIVVPLDDDGKPQVEKAQRIKMFKLEDNQALATDALLTEKATKWMILHKAIGDKGFATSKLVVIDVLEGTVHGYYAKPRGDLALDDISRADQNFTVPKEVLDQIKKPQKEGEKDTTPNGSNDKTFHYKFPKEGHTPQGKKNANALPRGVRAGVPARQWRAQNANSSQATRKVQRARGAALPAHTQARRPLGQSWAAQRQNMLKKPSVPARAPFRAKSAAASAQPSPGKKTIPLRKRDTLPDSPASPSSPASDPELEAMKKRLEAL